jgi:hypothetical protein
MLRDYIYDRGFFEERTRLAATESLWDPGSQRLLDGLGIGAGWRCLEVGAGGGSLVRLDDRSRRHSARDRYRHPFRRAARRRRGRGPAAGHPDRVVAALRPGGWMVIEDYDRTGFGLEDDAPRFEQVADA